MFVRVLMSSGEFDTWHDVADASIDNGALHVLQAVEEGEKLDGKKLVHVRTEKDQGLDLPPAEMITPFKLLGTYAPGMWMKVVYNV